MQQRNGKLPRLKAVRSRSRPQRRAIDQSPKKLPDPIMGSSTFSSTWWRVLEAPEPDASVPTGATPDVTALAAVWHLAPRGSGNLPAMVKWGFEHHRLTTEGGPWTKKSDSKMQTLGAAGMPLRT